MEPADNFTATRSRNRQCPARPISTRGSRRLVRHRICERIMDKLPDTARESPGRGARAAESDSLLIRASHSSRNNTVQGDRPYLRARPMRPLRRSEISGVYGQNYG
jgi:hypothetical protein